MIVTLKTKGNIRAITTYLIWIVSLLLSVSAYAQAGYVTTADTSVVTVERNIAQEKIDKYRSQSEYNYDQNPDYEESFFGMLWMKFLNWLKDLLGDGGYNLSLIHI